MARLSSRASFVAIASVVIVGCSSSAEDAASSDTPVVGADAAVSAPPGDGVKDGTETDVDCGGDPPANAPRCATGKACTSTSDCDHVLCTGNVCAVPSSTDGLKNGTETGIDCGGAAPTNASRCAIGATCAATSDCDAVMCTGGICQPASHGDGLRNGTETGIDCGGPEAGKCEAGGGCASSADCNSLACANGACQPPSNDDGFRNGTETDIDCGGAAPTNAKRCPVDAICATHDDCASSACAASGPKAGLCVPSKSCVANEGGFTCGRSDAELGWGASSQLESCCEKATVPNVTTKLDRFAITAGRMRSFITRLNGNVRGWVQAPATKPAGWNASWDMLVPATVADAEIMLGDYWVGAPNDMAFPSDPGEGPISKRSCGNDNYNGHTYWVSREAQAAQVYTQAQLDPKLLNCVGWHLVKAFCAWDGGHLATRTELRNAFTNGNTTTWPWEFAGGAYATPALSQSVLTEGNSAQDERLNHHYIYGYPGNEPASARITWWISPPGRFYKGWNANKIELAGNALEWTGDYEYNFVWQESFENHNGREDDGGDWRTPGNPADRGDVPNGYYALGARCAYP